MLKGGPLGTSSHCVSAARFLIGGAEMLNVLQAPVLVLT